MKYLFACDRKPRARKSYADRTGMSSRASVTLAAAVVLKPETFEDDNGNTIRVWKSSEMSSYSNADIASDPGQPGRGRAQRNARHRAALRDQVLRHQGLADPERRQDPLPHHPQGRDRPRPPAAASKANSTAAKSRSRQHLRPTPASNSCRRRSDASDPRPPHHQNPAPARIHRRRRLAQSAESGEHVPPPRPAPRHHPPRA